MQFKYLAALLASTTVSGVVAAPEPVINARALEAREEQAEQAAQAAQMQQAQQAQQAKQAAQMQQVNQGAQVQQAGQAVQVQQGTNAPAAEPKKEADPKTESSAFSIPFFGNGGSGSGITVNYDPVIDPYRRYPYYPDPIYPRPIYPDFPPVINPLYNFCPSYLQCNNNFDCVSFTVQTDFYGFNTCLTTNSYQRCSCTYPLPPFNPYGPPYGPYY
ncbi:hypothetical protein CKM354_000545000 [Cercospora kikuchii]|uniref:Uncharacterized protein n=1 Tax=Cercospora kikuchii TaxID=84275 RepID=A0A9P3CIU7_9PEZI|nr:uncharacterized protein CKM354_000545000 [Cercospora kikuchii]GIZ42172.1 hypothetical protein CKM354_000545000 [Cercospora kikuchii]